MEEQFLNHTIGAHKLACNYQGYHAFIDGKVDFDIKPSHYAKVIIKRIKKAYANRFIFEKEIIK